MRITAINIDIGKQKLTCNRSTDGVFVKDTPSQQLLQKRVNGRNALSGSTADEGFVFTPMNITTEADFIAWLKVAFPLLKDDDVAKVLLHYPMSNESTSSILFATTGDSGPTALDQSSVATGQQQRAIVRHLGILIDKLC